MSVYKNANLRIVWFRKVFVNWKKDLQESILFSISMKIH